MNQELEGLVKALDAARDAGGGEKTERAEAALEELIQKALEAHPNLSRRTLLDLVDRQLTRWRKAQEKFPTMPPKA